MKRDATRSRQMKLRRPRTAARAPLNLISETHRQSSEHCRPSTLFGRLFCPHFGPSNRAEIDVSWPYFGPQSLAPITWPAKLTGANWLAARPSLWQCGQRQVAATVAPAHSTGQQPAVDQSCLRVGGQLRNCGHSRARRAQLGASGQTRFES